MLLRLLKLDVGPSLRNHEERRLNFGGCTLIFIFSLMLVESWL